MAMRRKTFSWTIENLDADGVCASQAVAGPAYATLNGALISGGVLEMDMAQKVTVATTANLAAITWTIAGTDADGKDLSEDIVGANNETKTTTAYFKTVTSVYVSADTATDEFTVGITSAAISKTIPVSNQWGNTEIGIQIDVTGTINYTLQQTMQDVLAADSQPTTLTWQNHDTLIAQTADQNGNYVIPIAAIRLKVDSATTASVQFTVLHS